LANAAGKSGEKEKSAHYFRQWVNQDRRPAPSKLFPLSSRGLLPEIRAFYRKIAQEEAQLATPARVFKQIGSLDWRSKHGTATQLPPAEEFIPLG